MYIEEDENINFIYLNLIQLNSKKLYFNYILIIFKFF